MMLVGLSGSIGSGKTTFANYLSEDVENHQHWESWQVIAEIANGLRQREMPLSNVHDLPGISLWLNPLPQLVQEVTHRKLPREDAIVTDEKVAANPEWYDKLFTYTELIQEKPDLQLGPITEERKEELRSLLQWVGGFLAKTVAGDIWYTEIVRRIKNTPDLELSTVGGVRFPADAGALHDAGGVVLAIERPDESSPDGDDITEREVNQVPHDSLIVNDGNLDQLRACAKQVYKDLGAGALQASYQATQF